MNSTPSFIPASPFKLWGLVIASLCGIAVYLALRYGPLLLPNQQAWASLPLQLVVIPGGLWLIARILKEAWQGDIGADLLAALTLVAAVVLQEYLAAALIVLMLSGGQALEVYAMRKASSVLQALAERMPAVAHRRDQEHISDIAIADIAVGDLIVVYPHETAPVDGVVVEGHGSMDESYLTGEPYRVSKAPGAKVLSGAINGESALVLKAEKLPSDSRYAQIMEVMRQAEQKRPNLRRLGDRLGAFFAPLALAGAVAAWYFSGDAMRFLSVLMIATPCPLLIAIPIAIVSAISMAAKRGIVIKDPTVLERLPTCRTAIFDKTGTLTYGQPELTDIVPDSGFSPNTLLQQAASLERYSKHPLAASLLKAAAQAKLFLPEASQVAEKPGEGIEGTVEGHNIRITSRRWLLKNFPAFAPSLPPEAEGLECVVMQDGLYAATLRFRDIPRDEGESFIRHLGPSHRFNKVMLVSGDRETEVRYLARTLGIRDMLASQSPEQKLALVRAETAQAPTLFMGDGINDAPALTAATVGLAFGQHTKVTSEAAGAVIMESSLIKVDELMHLSLALRRVALQSALGGMFLSLLGMGFAAAGLLGPAAGALLQELIDVLAILNALRLIWGNGLKSDVA